jgi:hypothetical protein
MRIQRGDDDDIRALVERGSSTWVGPSPSARQARWAADGRPHRWMSAGLAAAGFGIAAFLTGSLTLFATSQSPNGAAASVVRLVSHVFTTPPAPVTPVPSPPTSAPPAPAAAPTPTGARPATARPAQPGSRPSPEPSDGPGHYPSPSPSPSGTAGPTPSPSPSRPPDE